MSFPIVERAPHAVPVHTVGKRAYKGWLAEQTPITRRWLESTGFSGETGAHALVPAEDGSLACVVAGVEAEVNLWSLASLATALPPGTYRLAGTLSNAQAEQLALGWALGAYRFERYRKPGKPPASLLLPKGVDGPRLRALAESVRLARDLINTPACDMLPSHLAAACEELAGRTKAKLHILTGEALLRENYPAIYTVGKASADAPRLIDLRWGKAGAPKVTLVGKGVCSDSGGLDIKPAGAMRLMKKDMGGAAVLMGLARAVMERKLPVRLRLLIPAVENAISGAAMRPLDVIRTRKGTTVEIGNTDAEGRLILADALTEADSEKPDLLIDCATLTGAARVALGTDMPALFTPDDALAAKLTRHALRLQDPLYRLPLWEPYRDLLKSNVAEMGNDTESSYAGAITAALFLKPFVQHTARWLHLDMMAWNLTARPGRPAGGEAQALRALFALLEEEYPA